MGIPYLRVSHHHKKPAKHAGFKSRFSRGPYLRGLFSPFGFWCASLNTDLLVNRRRLIKFKFQIAKFKPATPRLDFCKFENAPSEGKSRSNNRRSGIHAESMELMQGNAKALLCFFHKGAIMKWLVVLVVILFTAVPVLAEPPFVALIIPSWGVTTQFTEERADGSVFAIAAHEQDLHAVRGRARLYLNLNVAIEDIRKVRCGVIIGNYQVSDISKHLIEGYYGPELWFSHIPKGKVAKLAFYGEKFPVEIYAATFEVTSNEGNQENTWIRASSEPQEGGIPFYAYQEITLNDVCESF